MSPTYTATRAGILGNLAEDARLVSLYDLTSCPDDDAKAERVAVSIARESRRTGRELTLALCGRS